MGNPVIQTGNSFDSQSFGMGHARKVWRRIEEQLPGTGMITNLADFASAGLVRSGMALAKDTSTGADEQDYKAIPWADIISAQGEGGSGIDSLGIVGFLQEDVPVYQHGTSGSYTYNKGTCTVIVKGEIYGYMLGDTQEQATAVATAIKAMSQKNGLSIRVI